MTAKRTPEDADKVHAQALDDAVHALAQPLTAMLFVLDLGALNTDPQAFQTTLADARAECLRAIKALSDVRSAAHANRTNGEAPCP